MTTSKTASNYFVYNHEPMSNDDTILMSFNDFKEKTVAYNNYFNNRHSEVSMNKILNSIKDDVKKSHGHLNEQFELIDYLSRGNNAIH